MKISISRNRREGYYAGYCPAHIHFGRGGHRRWDAWAMSEFYPRIDGVYWQEVGRLSFNAKVKAHNEITAHE